MDRISEARLDALEKRIMLSPLGERGRADIVIDASIPPAPSMKPSSWLRKFKPIGAAPSSTVLDSLVVATAIWEGTPHEPHCPMHVAPSPAESALEKVESYDPKDSGNQAS